MVRDSSSLQARRVLVLEDNYLIADDTRRLLAKAGAVIAGPFRDAAAALAAADQHKPDCALVDVNLGQGPDFSPARALQARGVPVVFVTGYDGVVIPQDLSHMPRLKKPATARRLVAAVVACCGR